MDPSEQSPEQPPEQQDQNQDPEKKSEEKRARKLELLAKAREAKATKLQKRREIEKAYHQAAVSKVELMHAENPKAFIAEPAEQKSTEMEKYLQFLGQYEEMRQRIKSDYKQKYKPAAPSPATELLHREIVNTLAPPQRFDAVDFAYKSLGL